MAALGTPPPSSDITPEPLYLRRREFIKNSLLFSATAAGVGGSLLWLTKGGRATTNAAPQATDAATHAGQVAADGGKVAGPSPALQIARRSPLSTDESMTSERDVTAYNNFYEFGTDKTDPAENAGTLRPRPWTVAIEGEVASRGTIDIDELLNWFPLEERVYRMRCVEAWSMVIPWVGFPLGDLLKRVEPTSQRQVRRVQTLLDPEQMPGPAARLLEWPYVEGLRLDEAMHPLALLAVGLYGKELPNQNGAPLRLVVPWKYGFKGIKSIVKIRSPRRSRRRPGTSPRPSEYGFYANVNPDVDHPRWSQATERRIGELRAGAPRCRSTATPSRWRACTPAWTCGGCFKQARPYEPMSVTSQPPAIPVPRAAAPRRRTAPLPWLKPAFFAGSLLPLVVMAVRGVRGDLGANPIGEALNQLGLLALIFIVAALACTPLKTICGWTWPLRVRRMVGVFGFFYAVLHVSTYTGLDQNFDWSAIYTDVTKRKFIFVGFSAFVL